MTNNISKHHSSSLYYECLAKLILEQKLEIKLELCDKPDLQNTEKSIGIEVTCAFPEGRDQAISMMRSGKMIYGKLREMGYESNSEMPGVMFHPLKKYYLYEPFPTFNYAYKVVESKVYKSSNYRSMNDLRLFIVTDNLELDKQTLDLIVKKVIESGKQKFSYIYYQFLNTLLTIDIIKETFSTEEIEQIEEIKYRAKDLEKNLK